LTNDKKIVG